MQIKTKHILSKIQRFFDFSKGERRGILVLLLILFILLLFQLYYSNFYLPKSSLQLSNDIEQKVNNFYARQLFIKDSINNVYKNTEKNIEYTNKYSSVKTASLHPFSFNPNNLPENLWKALGLTDKQIKTIKNYEAKGGKFFVKEDLKKIYGISEKEYRQLELFITIPLSDNKNKQAYNQPKTNPLNLSIDINTTDSIELQKIPSIGAKIAGRIIRYRNALGGFVSKQQLLEVYGIDSNRYQQIISYFYINLNVIKKININHSDFNEMTKHPYVDGYLAKKIIQLREKNGDFSSLEDMQKQTKLYNDLFIKLKPYLTIQ